MKIKSFQIVTVLILALALLYPIQSASAEASTPTLTLTSSASSLPYHSSVTFTLTAAVTGLSYEPFGPVKFYADGSQIAGCSTYVNYVGNYAPGNPAICTTSALTPGVHVITANFQAYLPELYNDVSGITLDGGYTVTTYELIISPETLPNAYWATGYSQQFTAAAADGTTPGTNFWSKSGGFPSGFLLYDDTGVMEGGSYTTGSYTFTISVDNRAGGLGSREYTLNVARAVPHIGVRNFTSGTLYYDTPVDLLVDAYGNHTTNTNGSLAKPTGTVSFSVDGTPVAGCSGDNVKTFSGGATPICTINTAGFTVGSHTITAVYTPADTETNYAGAVGETTFTILQRYNVTGKIFYDVDQDGIKDSTEGAPSKGFKVIYDISCDGEADAYTWSENNISGDGEFSITKLDAGASFCMTVEVGTGETQTTTVSPTTLDGNKYFDIGVYYPDLTFSPAELPYGSVNVPYSQTITISGGTSPYTISDVESSSLPTGITFDASTLTVSGTPTQANLGILSFTATDATGFSKNYDGYVTIQTDGAFTLTSSSNPSDSGAAVTFTLSGTGDAIFPWLSTTDPTPPIGTVTFYADDVAIADCTKLYLNITSDMTTIGNYPVTCTTSALSDGEHVIKAVFTTELPVYRDATRTLTQKVGVPVDSTPPVITPVIAGTLGSNSWYTGNVALSWTVVDAESSITAQTGCDPVSITADQAQTTYTCSATSTGGTASVDAKIKRDATKPAAAITGVEGGVIYKKGNVPQAICSTTDNLSGVATAATLSISGGDTQGLGSITATCSGALDVAGNAGAPVSVSYTVALSADLKLRLLDSKDPARPGTSMSYILVVSNLSSNTAKSIVLTDTLDPFTTLKSISKPKGWSCSAQSGVITCTASKLDRWHSAIITIKVMVNKTAKRNQTLVNTAIVSSQNYDPVMTNNSATQKTRVK